MLDADAEGNRSLVVKKTDKRSSAEPTMLRVVDARTGDVLIEFDLTKDGKAPSGRLDPEKGPSLSPAGIAPRLIPMTRSTMKSA